MDWLGALMNAVSLAVGVAVGGCITFYLTKREIRKTFRELSNSKMARDLSEVLSLVRRTLESGDAQAFFRQLTVVLKDLTDKGKFLGELIALPEASDYKEGEG